MEAPDKENHSEDGAGARAPGAACIVDPVAAAGRNLEDLPPTDIVDVYNDGLVTRRAPGARLISPYAHTQQPSTRHCLPSRARSHIAALADSCVCDVSRRKVAAALKFDRSTLHGAPVAFESYCDRAVALRRLVRSSSAGRHPPRALPLRAPPRLPLRARTAARCAEAARSPALACAPRRPTTRATIARPRSAHERPWAAGARSVRWVSLAARCSSRPRRGTKVVTGGRWGGRRRLARRVASRLGGARAGRPRWPLRAALCPCCTHGPQCFVVHMSAAGQHSKLGTREVLDIIPGELAASGR